MPAEEVASTHMKWARFRYTVVGQLLTSPPPKGELRRSLEALASRTWTHPVHGQPCRFAFSTIERWFYRVRAERDPIRKLRRRVRRDYRRRWSFSEIQKQVLLDQYRAHRSWSVQLHYDNLRARGKQDASLGRVPSYSTVRRYMKERGLRRVRRRARTRDTDAARRVDARRDLREVRSYEMPHVHSLWHLDFHVCSRQVLLASGEWVTPKLMAFIDDRSRLCCHAQWYLGETAENLVHALIQAILKRELPRAIHEDNGSAMRAAELVEGLGRLGVTVEYTLPYSPHQNGKAEVFWGQVEGRLIPMLEHVKDLTLAQLNDATIAWVEFEYNQAKHRETKQAPFERMLAGPAVGRPAPSPEALRLVFGTQVTRTQRRSDGTVTLEGVRFEVPSALRNLDRLLLRYARWDLAFVHAIDPRTDEVVARLFPLDRTRNAHGRRKKIAEGALPPVEMDREDRSPGSLPPLLTELLARQAATGLPPAYLHQDETDRDNTDSDHTHHETEG